MTRKSFIVKALAAFGILAGGGAAAFVNQASFGRSPRGVRLTKMYESPHFHNGQFQNLVPVTVMSEKEGERENRVVAMAKFLFGDKSSLVPAEPINSLTPTIIGRDADVDLIIWLGHSSYYLQLGGKRLLIDPVFSEYASPIFFINKAFPGSNVVNSLDFPEIDALIVSHDHWDHLDYPTIISLKEKIRTVVCPLGVGEYFEQWGFNPEILREEDWDGAVRIEPSLTIHFLPSQHFSGRFIKQNQTQWAGFAFTTATRRVYFSGDGGYGEHFRAIGKKFGGFDYAIMENGQYNPAWHAIHMLPEETAQAAVDVGARHVIPAHNGKFALARHPWQEPYRALTEASKGKNYRLLTPMIGQTVYLDDPGEFSAWWEL